MLFDGFELSLKHTFIDTEKDYRKERYIDDTVILKGSYAIKREDINNAIELTCMLEILYAELKRDLLEQLVIKGGDRFVQD